MDLGSAREHLRAYILDLLENEIKHAGFRAEVCRLLAAPGLILSPQPRSRLALGVLACIEAVSSRPWSDMIPAAAALDLTFSAIEFVDKALDQEEAGGGQEWDTFKGLNVGLSLQALASRVLLDLTDRGFSWGHVKKAQEELTGIVAETSAAQHLDLLYEAVPYPTFEEALEMTVAKGGPLVSGVGRLGARLASEDPALTEPFVAFGWHAGAYAQLVNDLNDALPGGEHKTDVRRRKKTLPLLYLIRLPDGKAFQEERAWLTGDGPISPEQEEKIRQAIVPSGARDFTAVVADSYRARARDALRPLEGRVETAPLVASLLGDLP